MKHIAKLAAVLLQMYELSPERIQNPRLFHLVKVEKRDVNKLSVNEAFVALSALLHEYASDVEVCAREVTMIVGLLNRAAQEEDPIAAAIDAILGNEELAHPAVRTFLAPALLAINGRPFQIEAAEPFREIGETTLGEVPFPTEGHWLWTGVMDGYPLMGTDSEKLQEAPPEVLIGSTLSIIVRLARSDKYAAIEALADKLIGGYTNVNTKFMDLVQKVEAGGGHVHAESDAEAVNSNRLPAEWVETLESLCSAEAPPEGEAGHVTASINLAKVIGDLQSIKAGMIPPLSTLIAMVARSTMVPETSEERVRRLVMAGTGADIALNAPLPEEWKKTALGLSNTGMFNMSVPQIERKLYFAANLINHMPEFLNGQVPPLNKVLAAALFPSISSDVEMGEALKWINACSGLEGHKDASVPAPVFDDGPYLENVATAPAGTQVQVASNEAAKLPREWELTIKGLSKVKVSEDTDAFTSELVGLAKRIGRLGSLRNGFVPRLSEVLAVTLKPGNSSAVHLDKVTRVIDATSKVHELAKNENQKES